MDKVLSRWPLPSTKKAHRPKSTLRLFVESLEERIALNSAPVAVDDGPFSVLHGQVVAMDLKANDSDADGDLPTATIQITDWPDYGYLYENPMTGLWEFYAQNSYAGPDQFTYILNDGQASSSPATVTLNITNTAPTADGQSFSALHGQTHNGTLIGGDADAPDSFTFMVASNPSQGYLYVDPYTGAFTFSANGSYAGPDSFTFQTFDGQAYSAPATVNINITNTAPTANGQSFSVLHGQTHNGTLIGGDADAPDSLTFMVASYPSQGYLYFDPYTGAFTFSANGSYAGPDSFTFQTFDGQAYSAPATVNINITNTAPTANDQSFSVLHGQTHNGTLIGGDADAPDTFTFVVASYPSQGYLYVDPYTGAFTFSANGTYAGPDSFTFQTFDGQAYSAPATVNINITNTAPTANGQSFSVLHGQTHNGTLIGGDADAPDSLTFMVASYPSQGYLYVDPYTGAFTFSANGTYAGPDSFTFHTFDGQAYSAPATVSISITNTAPEILNEESYDRFLIVGETVQMEIGAFDPDGDDLTFQAVNLPPGLYIDTYTGVISGTVALPVGGSADYATVIQVSDGMETTEFTALLQVREIVVTAVTIIPPAGWAGALAASGIHSTFSFTVTATGPANGSADLLWSVGDDDPGPDDELVWERQFTINFNAAGQGTFTGQFGLFSDRGGQVKGVDGRSGESGPGDPAEVYVQIETEGGTDLRESARINVAGTANAPTGSTVGTPTTTTVTLTAPAGFTGTIDRFVPVPLVFSFTVTVTGTAGTTFTLLWSVIEPDSGTSAPDDELVRERSFTVTIGAGGTGTFTGQFILFANRSGEIMGVDNPSGETLTDPIYVFIERTNGTNLASSNGITVQGR